MKKETFLKKLKRLFCMGPTVLLTILIVDSITFFIKNSFPMRMGLTRTMQIAFSIILGMIFIFFYTWFMVMLKKFSMGLGVIKTGPYRIVRHPLYATFSLIIPLLIAIWFNDVWFLFSWILIIVIAHFIVKVEENILINKFDIEYLEYKQKVPAIIPYKGIVQL